MKTIIIVAAVLISVLSNQTFSQTNNPDGKVPSIHITPLVDWGKYDTPINQTDLKAKFGFLLLVKYPISDAVTITPFYEQNSFSLNVTQVVNKIYSKVEGNLSVNRAGVTFSFYFE